MNNWQEKTLGEVCFNASETFDLKKQDEVIFINTGDVLKNKFLHNNLSKVKGLPGQAKKSIIINDLLYSEIRPQNSRYALVDFDCENYVVSTKFMILRSYNNILPKYLLLLLSSNIYLKEFQLIAESRSGTFPQITFDSISYFPINLPPIDEQERIAEVLGSLDDKIENNNRMNKSLEQMAEAIFKCWFIDFEPVKAKMAGESEESICARLNITPEILTLFPNSLTESELGKIPTGWEVKTCGEVFDICGGTTPSTKNEAFWNGDINWVTPKDLSRLNSIILTNSERKITEAGLMKISSGSLPVNTVLMSSRAPVGYLSITAIETAINQGFIAFKENTNLPSEYTLNWLKHNMEEIKNRSGGSTFSEISKTVFRSIDKILPESEIINSYVGIAKAMYQKINENQKQSEELAKARDALLPKLISGEIRV